MIRTAKRSATLSHLPFPYEERVVAGNVQFQLSSYSEWLGLSRC
jgi:hypothetical protein